MDTDPLTLELRSYGSEVLTHSHDYHQLALPVTGEPNMSVGGHGGQVSLRQAAVEAAGQLSVRQVAECTGYGSLSAFSDRFHRHFGHASRLRIALARHPAPGA